MRRRLAGLLLAAASLSSQATPAPLSARPIVYVQGDLHHVLDGDRGDDVRDRFEVRRVRVGGDVRWGRLRAEMDVDPWDGEQWLKDAYVELRPWRRLRLRGGWQKLPTLAERDIGASRTDFVERSMAADRLAPGRDVGVSLRARVSRAELSLGAFAGDGYRERHRAGATLAARLEIEPRRGLVVAGVATTANVPDSTRPKGRDVEGPSGLELWPRSPAFGRRTRLGGDAGWRGRRWRLSGEWIRLAEQNPLRLAGDAADTVATAWAATGMWRLAEAKDDGRGPFIPRRTGTFAVGLRIEGARLRDPVDRRPKGRVYTAGLAWRPRAFLLLMVNLVHERAISGFGAIRARTTVFARLQVESPWGRDAP